MEIDAEFTFEIKYNITIQCKTVFFYINKYIQRVPENVLQSFSFTHRHKLHFLYVSIFVSQEIEQTDSFI